MYCQNCGFKNDSNAAFCGNCGCSMKGSGYRNNTNNNEKYNGLAIAGFVLSLISIFTDYVFIPGILALIFSIMALNQIKENGGKGKGLAMAGLIISLIFLVLYVLLFIVAFGMIGCAFTYL